MFDDVLAVLHFGAAPHDVGATQDADATASDEDFMTAQAVDPRASASHATMHADAPTPDWDLSASELPHHDADDVTSLEVEQRVGQAYDSGTAAWEVGYYPAYYAPQVVWDASQFDGVGDPLRDAAFWHEQQGQNSCAVVAQMSVYESITGQHIDEQQMCRIAAANRIYDPETGTYPQDVGKVLNVLGIPTEQAYSATLVDVARALERGDKVIVGLDAREINMPLRDAKTGLPIEQQDAGHAVWVTGIDQTSDGSVKIILNDSGAPDGQMKAVDAVDFLNAWGDYGNYLVIAHPPSAEMS